MKDKRVAAVVCDKASTLFNIAYVCGCGLAPPIGGLLADSHDFRFASDVMACTGLVLFTVYLVVGVILHEEKKDLSIKEENINQL